jgi:hypothetical protein
MLAPAVAHQDFELLNLHSRDLVDADEELAGKWLKAMPDPASLRTSDSKKMRQFPIRFELMLLAD